MRSRLAMTTTGTDSTSSRTPIGVTTECLESVQALLAPIDAGVERDGCVERTSGAVGEGGVTTAPLARGLGVSAP